MSGAAGPLPPGFPAAGHLLAAAPRSPAPRERPPRPRPALQGTGSTDTSAPRPRTEVRRGRGPHDFWARILFPGRLSLKWPGCRRGHVAVTDTKFIWKGG